MELTRDLSLFNYKKIYRLEEQKEENLSVGDLIVFESREEKLMMVDGEKIQIVTRVDEDGVRVSPYAPSLLGREDLLPPYRQLESLDRLVEFGYTSEEVGEGFYRVTGLTRIGKYKGNLMYSSGRLIVGEEYKDLGIQILNLTEERFVIEEAGYLVSYLEELMNSSRLYLRE